MNQIKKSIEQIVYPLPPSFAMPLRSDLLFSAGALAFLVGCQGYIYFKYVRHGKKVSENLYKSISAMNERILKFLKEDIVINGALMGILPNKQEPIYAMDWYDE